MTVKGHCNCGSITVEIPYTPEGSVLCYCANCQRASAGLCSANFLFHTSEIRVHDANGTLRDYKDSNTKSGNTITRQFCGNCGSPAITRLGEGMPKVIVKAGLFDTIPKPFKEVFKEERKPWMRIIGSGEEESQKL